MTSTTNGSRRSLEWAALLVVAASVVVAWWWLDREADRASREPGATPTVDVGRADPAGDMLLPDHRAAAHDVGTAPPLPTATPALSPATLDAPVDRLVVRVSIIGDTPRARPAVGAAVFPAPAAPGVREITDADGRCALPLAALVDASLQVRHAGCFPASVSPDRIAAAVRDAAPLKVELVPSYPLHGRVGAWGSDAVPAGIAVLAWKGHVPPTRDEVFALLDEEHEEGESGAERAARREDPAERTLLLTRTEFGGAFRFPARVPPGTWTLLAAGQGLATLDPLIASVQDRQAIQLQARSAHAAALQITDHQGAPQEAMPGVTDFTTSWGQGSPLDPRRFTPVERLLLGIEVPPSWRGVLLVDARQPERAATAGPLTVNFRQPGFDHVSKDIHLPNTRDGLLLETLTLTPNWEPLGELTVVLKGWDERTAGLVEAPYTTLDMHTDDGQREHVYLRDLADDRVHLVGLRQGTYTRAHLGIDGLFGTPDVPLPIVISDVPATITLDFADYALLDLVIEDAQGKPIDGNLNLFLILADSSVPNAGMTAYFMRAPYRVPFLATYRWTLRIEYARELGSDPSGYEWPTVHPKPGERLEVVLRPGG